MIDMRGAGAALAAAAMLASTACARDAAASVSAGSAEAQAAAKVTVTVRTRGGAARQFSVEVARTVEQQERGLMYRTGLPADGGMLFAPYPAEGGGPREASFWMRNTPTALDILFIRPDGTIARIVENAQPFSEDRILSGEPVSAVLEINAGKSAELGIAAGDKVSWPNQDR